MPATSILPSVGSRAARWGALALLVRPTYVAAELFVAAAATGDYSLVADSISRLGESSCSAGSCSPRHDVMNAAFVVSGALLAGGAALLSRAWGPTVTGLLVVSGLSSVATGLAPLDRDVTLHVVAATPLFVAQPLALVALGLRLRSDRPRLARALVATGAVTGAAAAAFVLAGDGAAAGALERLAIWPVLVALAGAAGAVARPRAVLRPAGTGGTRSGSRR